MEMSTPERIRSVMEFKPVDRLPILEWGPWWNETVARWHTEGLDPTTPDLNWATPGKPVKSVTRDMGKILGLDPFRLVWLALESPHCPREKKTGAGIISNAADYHKIKPFLYPDPAFELDYLKEMSVSRKTDGMALWMWIEGFFWVPRKLLGIEPHLFAFYDQPELLEEINSDLLSYYQRVLPLLFDVMTPDIFLIAEDLSYNHGPMLSKPSFDRIMAPYYHDLTRLVKSYGVHPIMDSDGDITPIIPWLYEVGVEGLGPLERMAGVDVVKIRRAYPDFLMIGGFDKTTMHQGEKKMRLEFERLLPVIEAGGCLLTVDHQTPPECSLDNYHLYRRLFLEYATF
jgi:hypothetical protein